MHSKDRRRTAAAVRATACRFTSKPSPLSRIWISLVSSSRLAGARRCKHASACQRALARCICSTDFCDVWPYTSNCLSICQSSDDLPVHRNDRSRTMRGAQVLHMATSNANFCILTILTDRLTNPPQQGRVARYVLNHTDSNTSLCRPGRPLLVWRGCSSFLTCASMAISSLLSFIVRSVVDAGNPVQVVS